MSTSNLPSNSSVTGKHPEIARFPLMEQPLVGVVLAFIAGTLNAWTLANASTFATVQSGNVISSGFYLVQGDWAKFTPALISIFAFGIGSAACGVVMTSMLRKKKSFTAVVLFIQVAILAVLTVLAMTHAIDFHYVAYAVSFVAGAQGNAFHKDHGMLYGNVAVTFVVQMAFNFLVQSFFKKQGINGEPNLFWSGIFFSILLGFAAGAAVGFGADLLVNGASLALAAVFTLGLAIRAQRSPSGVDPDPTPGGSFA